MLNSIKIYSAPLQGYTDHVWRNTHHEVFGGIDTYCTPFVRLDGNCVRKKDLKDILPENNNPQNILPQIIGCNADDAVKLVMTLKEFGYDFIDINLGCPHPPIALHHKGSGLLKYPDEIEKLFSSLARIDNTQYSIKMRLGWDQNNQWEMILPLFDILNPQHVTIHPKTGRQQYKGDIDFEQFEQFVSKCRYPLVYNGGITDISDCEKIANIYEKITGIMVGRGLVANPHMFAPDRAEDLAIFHHKLYTEYSNTISGGDHQVLSKMKSLWEIFLPQSSHKHHKAIKKCKELNQYLDIAEEAIADYIESLKI